MRTQPRKQPGACGSLFPPEGRRAHQPARQYGARAHYLTANRILSDLSADEFGAFGHEMEVIWLESGDILADGSLLHDWCFFPLTAVISMTATLEDGRTAGVGFVGREGMVGLRNLLGFRTGFCAVEVQVPGFCSRLPTETLRDRFRSADSVRDRLLQYFALMYTEACQSIVCNRAHLLGQRLCRWLLELRDRVTSDELNITHESLAQLLGATRADTSRAAGKLREMNLLRLSHGRMTILDRGGIESAACECYGAAGRSDIRAGQGSRLRQVDQDPTYQPYSRPHAMLTVENPAG